MPCTIQSLCRSYSSNSRVPFIPEWHRPLAVHRRQAVAAVTPQVLSKGSDTLSTITTTIPRPWRSGCLHPVKCLLIQCHLHRLHNRPHLQWSIRQDRLPLVEEDFITTTTTTCSRRPMAVIRHRPCRQAVTNRLTVRPEAVATPQLPPQHLNQVRKLKKQILPSILFLMADAATSSSLGNLHFLCDFFPCKTILVYLCNPSSRKSPGRWKCRRKTRKNRRKTWIFNRRLWPSSGQFWKLVDFFFLNVIVSCSRDCETNHALTLKNKKHVRWFFFPSLCRPGGVVVQETHAHFYFISLRSWGEFWWSLKSIIVCFLFIYFVWSLPFWCLTILWCN